MYEARNSLPGRWAFNSSSEVVDIQSARVRSAGKGRSQVSYVPTRHQDYGSLLCWASNDVGVQRQPCIYHVIHACECCSAVPSLIVLIPSV